MRWLVAALMILSSLTASSAAPPEAMTADDLEQLCSGEDHVSKNACRIYILGVTQGIAVGMHMAAGKPRASRPCIPAGISAQELEQTVHGRLAADLKASPAHRNREASGFIGEVLAATFPCPKPGG